MALSHEDMDRMIDEHFDYEARDDVAGVLATLAPDATHDVVGWPTGPSKGREAARPFYETLFADMSDGQVASTKRLYGEKFIVDDSIWRGKAPGQPFGLEGRNRPLEFRILHVVEFTDDGHIETENVWLDMAAIQQQLPQG